MNHIRPMRFELSHDKQSISGDDLLTDIRRVAPERRGQQVRQRTYKELGRYGVTTIIRRFGSWNLAVKAAGLETTVERNVSDEKLYSALFDLRVTLGRQPSYSEVQSPACPFHVTTYERRFGSWRQALEAFVFYANSDDMTPPPLVARPCDILSRRASRSPDQRLRFKVLQRGCFRCRACGASPSFTRGVLLDVDHVDPWSKGGETVISNLQTLCSACDQGKTNHRVVQHAT